MYGNVVVEWMDVETDVWKIAWLTESAFPWFTRVTGLPLITNLIQSLMEILQLVWQYSGLPVKCIQLCRKAVSENAAVRTIVTGLKMLVVSTADLVSYLSSSSMSVRKWQLWRQALNILSKLLFSNFFSIKAFSYKKSSTSKKFYSILNGAKPTVRYSGIRRRNSDKSSHIPLFQGVNNDLLANLWGSCQGVNLTTHPYPMPI